MSIYVKWFGGPSYAHPDYDDFEVFENVDAAREALNDRERIGHHFQLPVVNAKPDVRPGTDEAMVRTEESRVFFPCVEDSRMEVYLYNPFTVTDRIPDLTIYPEDDAS